MICALFSYLFCRDLRTCPVKDGKAVSATFFAFRMCAFGSKRTGESEGEVLVVQGAQGGLHQLEGVFPETKWEGCGWDG